MNVSVMHSRARTYRLLLMVACFQIVVVVVRVRGAMRRVDLVLQRGNVSTRLDQQLIAACQFGAQSLDLQLEIDVLQIA
jgi:hypothetical protein